MKDFKCCPACGKRVIPFVASCYHCGHSFMDDPDFPRGENVRLIRGRHIDLTAFFEVLKTGNDVRAARALSSAAFLTTAEAEEAVRFFREHPTEELPPQLTSLVRPGERFDPDAVLDAVQDGKTLAAIKELRRALNLGLIESRNLIQSLVDPYGEGDETL